MGTLRKKMIFILTSIIAGILFLLASYFVLIQTGIIQSRRIQLTIVAGSFDKPYDGTPLECSSYKISYGNLRDEHSITVSYHGSQTEVGISQANVVATITDTNGVDVTKKYDIEYVPGTLTVGKRYLQLSTESAEKFYDGKPLTENGYQIEMGELLRGHILKTTAVSQITAIGETENVITATVMDADGKNVTENYDINYIYGRLTVLSNKLVVSSTLITKVYDGTPLVANRDEIPLVFTAGNDMISALHHRVEVDTVGEITDVGKADYQMTVTVYDENGEDVTNLYDVETNCGGMEVTPKEVTLISSGANKTYDGTPLVCNEFTQPDGLILGDTMEASLGGSQTDVGSSPNFFNSYKVIDINNNDVTKNYKVITRLNSLVINPIRIHISTNSNHKAYDGTPLTDMGYSYSGTLLSGHELVVENYGSITEIGTVKNDCHVKVIDKFNNDKDVSHNYYWGEPRLGELEITSQKKVIYVKTPSTTEVYDGMAHFTSGSLVEVVDATQLSEGHQIIYENFETISVVDAGVHENKVVFFTVYDTVNRADVTSEYEIGYNDGDLGKITITQRMVKFITPSYSKAYDGSPFTEFGNATSRGGDLLAGHSLTSFFVVGDPRYIVGTYANDVKFTIMDQNGNDVSKNYMADPSTLGRLEITPAVITITCESNQRIGDSDTSNLTVENYSVDGLKNYDSISSITFTTITYVEHLGGVEHKQVNSADCVIEIISADGENVTECYVIEIESGSLVWM